MTGVYPASSISSRKGSESWPLSATTAVPGGTSTGTSLSAGTNSCCSETSAAAISKPNGNPLASTTTLPASCPCRPWFFRRRHPFFCADERGIREQLVEIELAELVELPDQDGMDIFQHTFAGPFLEPAPAGAPRGQVDGDVPPSCAIAQQPKDTLQALAVIDPRSAALEVRCVLRK